ncbi:MAG: DUF6029 family protein [Rikenellaceae bacterium]
MSRFNSKQLLLSAVALSLSAVGSAQDKGRVSGSFESNSIYYIEDTATGANAPYAIGSNNYLKVDYTLGRLSAGIQAEYYPEVLQGFQDEFKGFAIPTKYIAWNDTNYSVTIGDYYEQFGSGLVLRSWEDRQLGHNNSLGGARVTFNTSDNALSARVVYGVPRDYLNSVGRGYDFGQNIFDSYSSTQVVGADLNFMLSQLLMPESMHNIYLEGSVVNRFEPASTPLFDIADYSNLGLSQSLFSYSARLGYEYGGLAFKFEHVGKGEDLYFSHKSDEYELKAGNAQLAEVNYSTRGFSASALFRRLENMSTLAYRVEDMSAGALPANTINYVPALSQQQSYMLASFNPYAGYASGEIGGQVDLFYTIPRGSAIGGKYGIKLHANSSMYYTPASALSASHNEAQLSYRDITFDVEKKWNRKLKTILFMTIQELSPSHGEKVATEAQNIFVADVTYSFNHKFSLRGELQYLYSEELTKDWIGALLEANFAPKWSLFASDMYNHGESQLHYYSVGAAYTYSMFRVAASYGRNREGMVCSGGVCRWQPAYTGGNLQVSILF